MEKEEMEIYAEEWFKLQAQKRKIIEKIFPPEPPNDKCKDAFLQGLCIENSFEPEEGEYNFLFETESERVYVWTHKRNKYSSIVIEVNEEVKSACFWKNIGSIIRLAIRYSDLFESDLKLEYKWIYNFNPMKGIEESVFYKVSNFGFIGMDNGRIIKATNLLDLAQLIELMIRDDKVYVALMMLDNSFMQHNICLTCELSSYPYHDHLTEEPEIWEHAYIIQDMENAIIQACRSVEAILGEPPNRSNRNGLIKHKQKWENVLGLNPDDSFQKSGIAYMDFYYELFFELRNPSAHSYGNIHYELKRKRTIQAQCFASIILTAYINKNVSDLEIAQTKLNFNKEFLERVSEDMSTKMTK